MGSIEEEDSRFCQATTSACLEHGQVDGVEKNRVWLWDCVGSSSALSHWSHGDSKEHQACTEFNLFCPYGTVQCPFIMETKGFTAVYARTMDPNSQLKACALTRS